MEKRKEYHIGVFDSGVGGLTVMQQLRIALPSESMIYFGDTARLPYGSKSRETVIRYSIENAVFLMEKKIKLLVVACNTACSVALEKLQEIFNIPIVGVIVPGAEKAVSVTSHGRIAVLGTKGTIQSGAYQQEILRLMPEAHVIPIACPLFVPLTEERFLSHPASQLIVKEYLKPLKEQHVDTLLLGCTHYPLMRDLIEQEISSDVKIVDSASTCAEKVDAILTQHKMKNCNSKPNYQYFASDDPDKFRDLAEKLFGESIPVVKSHSHL